MPALTEFSSAFLTAFDSHCLHEGVPAISTLSIDEAYSVQQLVIESRLSRGERAVGYKVGCTSSAIRRQFGLNEPICGRVMEPHVHRGDASVKWGDFFQPAVEPEFVLRIGRDLTNVHGGAGAGDKRREQEDETAHADTRRRAENRSSSASPAASRPERTAVSMHGKSNSERTQSPAR